ncbi:MAG: cupin domain-containing protein [Desulfopila sp.]
MSVSSVKKRRVSSGIADLDRLMGELYIGDNVLWYEDAGSFSAPFCLGFIKETLARKGSLVYVSFDRSPKNLVSFLGTLAESQNLTILDCFTNGQGNRSEVFNTFYEKNGALWPYKVIKVNDPTNPELVAEAIYALHATLAGTVHFILDSLTGMQALWEKEEQVIDFYSRTCPRLYELDTIAYWLIEKEAHSDRLKAHINKITQVAIDLSVRREKTVLKIFKAEERNSKFLNEHQVYLCEGANIVFASQRQHKLQFHLGAKIKSVRLMRGISQKKLARMTGVTPSTISQVEKSLIYPSLPALFRIAESLEVEVATLLKEAGRPRDLYVHPAASRSTITLAKNIKDGATAALLLPPEIESAVEVTLVRILPGRRLPSHFFAHKGEEMGYLLTGRLEMTIENQSYEVQAGDMMHLQKDTPGGWSNISDQTAELLWIKVRR